MPEAIPPELKHRLRTTLLRCGPFESDRALRATFVDARIAPWRDAIPDNTPSRGRRVDDLIDALCDQSNDRGENALVLFLQTLADRANPGDACHHHLAQLAGELAAVSPDRAGAAEPATPTETGPRYIIHADNSQIGAIGDHARVAGGIHFDPPPRENDA
jgi:hypothetical protein